MMVFVFWETTIEHGAVFDFELRGATRYVSGYQGLKPSLNLWIIHDHSTSRFGDFRFVMGVHPHHPSQGWPWLSIVTYGDDWGSPRTQSKAKHFSGALQPAVSWARSLWSRQNFQVQKMGAPTFRPVSSWEWSMVRQGWMISRSTLDF